MKEKYILWRTDIPWISRIKSTMDYKVLLWLVNSEDQKTDIITVNTYIKKNIANFFSVSERTIHNSIKSLQRTDFLIQVGKASYRANPTALSLGTIVAYRRKLKVWNRLNSINT